MWVFTKPWEERFNNTGKYATIHDLLPGVVGAELQKCVDLMYLVAKDVTLPFVSSEGEWLHDRDPLNDRGDAATVAERKASWEKNGLYSDIRAGAWVPSCCNHEPHPHYSHVLDALRFTHGGPQGIQGTLKFIAHQRGLYFLGMA